MCTSLEDEQETRGFITSYNLRILNECKEWGITPAVTSFMHTW